MTTSQIHQALGHALAKLDDPSFATAEGFLGGRKGIRLLRTTHARASSMDRSRITDLGRVIFDSVSPRSRIASLYERLVSSLSGNPS
jgi:hypothetical protein